MEKRTQRIDVRVTKKEKELIDGFANSLGMTASALLRDRALKTKVKVRNKQNDDVLKLVAALNKIGNNVNQIARKVNSRGMTDGQLKLALKSVDFGLEKITRLFL